MDSRRLTQRKQLNKSIGLKFILSLFIYEMKKKKICICLGNFLHFQNTPKLLTTYSLDISAPKH